MVAAARDAQKNDETGALDKAIAAGTAIARNVTQLPFLSGWQNLTDSLSTAGNAQAAASRLGGNIASGMVPASAFLRRTAQGLDPTVRDTGTVEDVVRAGIPGLSSQLPARPSPEGGTVQRENGGVVGSLFNPILVRTPQGRPATQELLRLGEGYTRTGGTIAGQRLTPEQQRRYDLLLSQAQARSLEALFASPEYRAADDGRKQDLVNAVKDAAGRRARQQVMGEAGISTREPGEPPKYTLRAILPVLREKYQGAVGLDQLARDISAAAQKVTRYRRTHAPADRPTPEEMQLAAAQNRIEPSWLQWRRLQRPAEDAQRRELERVTNGVVGP